MHQILNRLHCTERQSTRQSRWFKFALKKQAPLPATSPLPPRWLRGSHLAGHSPWSSATREVAQPPHGSSPWRAPWVPTMQGHHPEQFCYKMQNSWFSQTPNLPVEARGLCEAAFPWLCCKHEGNIPPLRTKPTQHSLPKTPCSSSEHIVHPWQYTICGNSPFPNAAVGGSLSEGRRLWGESRTSLWGAASQVSAESRLAEGLR